jgi:hypothetical protein
MKNVYYIYKSWKNLQHKVNNLAFSFGRRGWFYISTRVIATIKFAPSNVNFHPLKHQV